MNLESLGKLLERIDGKSYKAYKDIQGEYTEGPMMLAIDHAQGDPFAAPSRLRCRFSQVFASIDPSLYSNRTRQIACQDLFARIFANNLAKQRIPRDGSGKSGLVQIDAGGQTVLERTACVINPNFIEFRFEVGLPADGRRILGQAAHRLLIDIIPRLGSMSARWSQQDQVMCTHFVNCIENQEYIRNQLNNLGLIAFVANGSILPRQSGDSSLPLAKSEAVAFQSPIELEVTMPLLHPIQEQMTIRGMGIRHGLTLIVGGGFHGKSTLLRAIQDAVYPHVPEDGREYVVSDAGLVKVRAEDGRSISCVDISPFINRLPTKADTSRFSTTNASGSTSQAAGIIEAMELGATGILLDDDTSASNFLARDARMQELVQQELEPITPFIDRIDDMIRRHNTAVIMVVGGSGDYLDRADQVIAMESYIPLDANPKVEDVLKKFPSQRQQESRNEWTALVQRYPDFTPVLQHPYDRKSVEARRLDSLAIERKEVDLRAMEQLVDPSQTRAIAAIFSQWLAHGNDTQDNLDTLVHNMLETILQKGLSCISSWGKHDHHPGNLALPRKFEIAAALNRCRTLEATGKST